MTVYRVIDDTANTAGQTGTPGAATSGTPLCADFSATSTAAAITVAHIICSALQRPGRLVIPYAGSPPWTLVQGAPANVAITAVPSGVSY